MNNKIQLDLEIGMTGEGKIGLVASEVRELGESSDKAKEAVGPLQQELASLQKKAAAQAGLVSVKDAITKVDKASAAALEKLAKLSDKIDASAAPSAKLTSQYQAQIAKVNELGAKKQELIVRLDAMRGRMKAAGLDTENLTKNQVRLNDSFAQAKAKAAALQDEYGKASKAASDLGRKTRQAATQGGDGLFRLKDSASAVRAELVALAASGAGIGAVVKQATDFESAMADVRKVVTASDDEFSGLTGSIKEMATQLPISADGLAQIAAEGAKLGVPIDKLREFTELAAKMAVAFDMTAEEAGQAMAKLSNIFGIPIQQVERLGDAINTLGNNTAATEGQIVDALVRIGGTSKQFGLAAEEAAALADAMIAIGKPPEVAATAINAMLSRLQTANVQSAQFQDGLGRLGISAEDLAVSIREKPQQALLEFLSTLEELDNQSRAEALTNLFGQEHQDEVSALVGSLDQYRKALGMVADDTRTAGAMQSEFEARSSTTANQLERLKGSVEVLAINLGSVLLPAVNQVAGGLTGIANGVASFAEAHPQITVLAEVIGTALLTVGALSKGFKVAKTTAVEMGAAGAAAIAKMNQPIASATAAVGMLNTALLGIGAVTIGWDIGSSLFQEYEDVRRIGLALVAGINEIGIQAQIAWKKAWSLGEVTPEIESLERELANLQTTTTQLWIEYGDAARNAHETRRDETAKTADAEQAAHASQLQRLQKEREAADQNSEIYRQAAEIQRGIGLSFEEAQAKSAGYAAEVERIDAELRNLQGSTADGKQRTDELAASLKQLGIDAKELETGISSGSREMIAAFTAISTSAQATGEQITQGFNAAVSKADSLKALRAVVQQMAQAQAEESVSTKEAAAAKVEASKKAAALMQAMGGLKGMTDAEKVSMQQLIDELNKLGGQTIDAGDLDQTKKDLEDIGNKGKEAGTKVSEGMDQAAESTEKMGETVQVAENPLAQFMESMRGLTGMTEATAQAFDQFVNSGRSIGPVFLPGAAQIQQTGGTMAELREELRKAEEGIQSLQGTVAGYAEHQSILRIAEGALNIRRSWAEQSIAAEELRQRLADLELASDRQLDAAERAASGYEFLDQQQLDGILAEVERLRSANEQLEQSVERTLEGLRNELDQLQGNREAIEKRDYESRKADLESQLKAAENAGNAQAIADLREALQLNEEIHRQKVQAIEAERKAAEQRDREQAKRDAERKQQEATTPASTSSTTSRSATTETRTTTERVVERGATININITGSVTDDRATLEQLARKLQPILADLTRRGA